MFVSESFVIKDIYYANVGDTNKSSDIDIANRKVLNSKVNGSLSITHDTDKYTLVGSGFGNQSIMSIPKLNGLTSDYKFSAIVKNTGVIIYNTPVLLARVEGNIGRAVSVNNWNTDNWSTIGTSLNNLDSNTEYEVQIISNGSSFTVKIFNLSGTQLGSWSYSNSSLNNSSNTVYMGIWAYNGTATLRNITLELL